jgi:hypothetical protein
MCTLIEIDVLNAFYYYYLLRDEHKFLLSIGRQTREFNWQIYTYDPNIYIFYIPQRHLKLWISEYLKCSSLLR